MKSLNFVVLATLRGHPPTISRAADVCSLLILATFLTISGPRANAAGVPHRVNGISITNGFAALQFDGSVSNLFPSSPVSVADQYRQMGDLYLVDVSPDLAHWQRQASLLRTNGDPSALYWLDTNGVTGAKFYRLVTNDLITMFPQPIGPYAVGEVVRVLNDPTRAGRYGIRTNSSFMSTIWYPAAAPAAGALPGPYTDPAVAANDDFFTWPAPWTNIIAACTGQAYSNAPVAPGSNRFPIIVYSHGLGCDRVVNTKIAIDLASRGYIVAGVDHIDCHCTVYPTALGVCYGSGNADFATMKSRTNDMEFLLTTLARYDASDPLLAGRLALDHIGAMGWSFGGSTAAESAWGDARVKCAALLDPYISTASDPILSAVGLQKPFLTMNDTVPVHTDGLPLPAQFESISSNLFHLAASDATWFAVSNASHTTFADWAWCMEGTSGSRGAARAIGAAIQWFFDTHLKGLSSTFPTNAEILRLQQK
jgi:dienelactone hydrolase